MRGRQTFTPSLSQLPPCFFVPISDHSKIGISSRVSYLKATGIDTLVTDAGSRALPALAALQGAGLAWGAYELNSALCLALDDPDADAAWRAGADPLAAAAVADGRPDEMQAVFAQLRAGGLASGA